MTTAVALEHRRRLLDERAVAAMSPAPPRPSHPLVQVQPGARSTQARAQETCSRAPICRACTCSRASSRAAAARRRAAQFDGGVDGLGLDRANWAAGVQVVVSQPVRLLEPARAQGARRPATDARRGARYDEALLTRHEPAATAAAAMVEAARAIAANTPVQLAAAQQSEAQARARYDAGLASIIEVADAQNLLAQAEVQDAARARRRVARAARPRPSAQGDLAPFVDARSRRQERAEPCG